MCMHATYAHVSFLFSLIDVTFLPPDGVAATRSDAAACVGAGGEEKIERTRDKTRPHAHILCFG